MKRYRAEEWNSLRLTLGEGMVWDDEKNHALWVDIPEGCVYEADENGALLRRYLIPDLATTVALAVDGSLIVSGAKSVYRVERDTGAHAKIAELSDIPSNQRFNDGKCDGGGRLMVGTMVTGGGESNGKLYSIAAGGRVRELLSGLRCSNGIGFSPCGRYVYHIDTPTKKVRRYRYDPETGAISDPAVAVDTEPFEGIPDGMTVDRDGRLYVAMWGGGAVLCFGNSGELLARVELPCKFVTSCAFGGPSLARLLITTASQDDVNPHAGKTYWADVEAFGTRTFRFS